MTLVAVHEVRMFLVEDIHQIIEVATVVAFIAAFSSAFVFVAVGVAILPSI